MQVSLLFSCKERERERTCVCESKVYLSTCTCNYKIQNTLYFIVFSLSLSVGGVVKKTRKREKQKASEVPLPPLLAKNNENLLVSGSSFETLLVMLITINIHVHVCAHVIHVNYSKQLYMYMYRFILFCGYFCP